jgi:hypothetical protein
MSGLVYTRGGIPAHVNRTTAVATVEKWDWSGGPANWLWFKNTSGAAIVLSFTRADADAAVGVSVAAGAVWEGPAEVGAIYTKAAGAQTFESVVFIRRG